MGVGNSAHEDDCSFQQFENTAFELFTGLQICISMIQGFNLCFLQQEGIYVNERFLHVIASLVVSIWSDTIKKQFR
jgi:hypothetical protein